MSPASQSQVLHHTYSAFVEEGNDLVGLIAYALYKSEKIQYVERRHSETGAQPSTEELSAFIRVFNMPAQIQAYRRRAEELLEAMNEELLDGVVVQLNKETHETLQSNKEEYQIKLAEELKAARGFWKSVGENIVANLAAAAIAIVLVILVYGSQINLIPALGSAFGYTVTANEPAK